MVATCFPWQRQRESSRGPGDVVSCLSCAPRRQSAGIWTLALVSTNLSLVRPRRGAVMKKARIVSAFAVMFVLGGLQIAVANDSGTYKVSKPQTSTRATTSTQRSPQVSSQNRTSVQRSPQTSGQKATTTQRSTFKPSNSPTLNWLRAHPNTGQANGRGAPSSSKEYDNSKPR